MKIKTLGFIIIVIVCPLDQIPCKGQRTPVHDAINMKTDEIYDSLVNIRRYLHENPELPGQELQTSRFIEKYLKSLGLEVKTNIGGYGVVGILNTHENGKKIAWRADIDAFKTDLPDVVEFKSKNKGVRHICGHDVHTAIGLGIANVLSAQQEKLDGTVYFIFQPSEENAKGAESMINDGLFDMVNPDEIYGLHVNPMPVGLLSAKSDEVYAYMKKIEMKFKNVQDKDSLIAYSKSVFSSLTTVKPDSEFWNGQTLGDPEIGISSPNTVYKNYMIASHNVTMEENGKNISIITILTGSNAKLMKSIPGKLKEQIKQTDFGKKLVSVKYTKEFPNVVNDPDLTKQTLSSISLIYGPRNIAPVFGVIPNFNDDFARFQEIVPGVYYFLGGSNFQKGLISMPHSPNFAVDEECIRYGVKYFSSMIYERIENE